MRRILDGAEDCDVRMENDSEQQRTKLQDCKITATDTVSSNAGRHATLGGLKVP